MFLLPVLREVQVPARREDAWDRGGGLLPCPQGQESLPIRAPVWTAGRRVPQSWASEAARLSGVVLDRCPSARSRRAGGRPRLIRLPDGPRALCHLLGGAETLTLACPIIAPCVALSRPRNEQTHRNSGAEKRRWPAVLDPLHGALRRPGRCTFAGRSRRLARPSDPLDSRPRAPGSRLPGRSGEMSEPLACGCRSAAGCAGNQCGCPGLRPPLGGQQAGHTNNAANAKLPPPLPDSFQSRCEETMGPERNVLGQTELRPRALLSTWDNQERPLRGPWGVHLLPAP